MFFDRTRKVWTRPSSYSIRPVAERDGAMAGQQVPGAAVPKWVSEVGVRSKRAREEVEDARKI